MIYRPWLLALHVLGAVCWVAMIAVCAAVEPLVWTPFQPAAGVVQLARYGLTPCAAVVIVTGFELARSWGGHWPRTVIFQLVLGCVLLILTGALAVLDPIYTWPLRVAQLAVLASAFILAVLLRTPVPDQPPNTGGKHRKLTHTK